MTAETPVCGRRPSPTRPSSSREDPCPTTAKARRQALATLRMLPQCHDFKKNIQLLTFLEWRLYRLRSRQQKVILLGSRELMGWGGFVILFTSDFVLYSTGIAWEGSFGKDVSFTCPISSIQFQDDSHSSAVFSSFWGEFFKKCLETYYKWHVFNVVY